MLQTQPKSKTYGKTTIIGAGGDIGGDNLTLIQVHDAIASDLVISYTRPTGANGMAIPSSPTENILGVTIPFNTVGRDRLALWARSHPATTPGYKERTPITGVPELDRKLTADFNFSCNYNGSPAGTVSLVIAGSIYTTNGVFLFAREIWKETQVAIASGNSISGHQEDFVFDPQQTVRDYATALVAQIDNVPTGLKTLFRALGATEPFTVDGLIPTLRLWLYVSLHQNSGGSGIVSSCAFSFKIKGE
ncbi:MAG: hypothetical protein ACRC62_15615 [Microcoleus sp.]